LNRRPEELEPLRQVREAEDTRIMRHITELDEASLEGAITYRSVFTPEAVTQPLAPALAHWFNHQTHHRGQAHALQTGLVGRAPELDLLFYQRLAEKGLA
jgi:uncharacterized damage-inducible protein DinB